MYKENAHTICFVKDYDPEVADLMFQELYRQRRNIELIASENIASPAVIAAMGHHPHQQVCRGPAREPVLRRLRIRGRN